MLNTNKQNQSKDKTSYKSCIYVFSSGSLILGMFYLFVWEEESTLRGQSDIVVSGIEKRSK